MWLVWSFDADVRAWLAALLFPRKWLGGFRRREVAALSPSAFVVWLVASNTPMQVCQLLSCPKCWSAHVAGVGTLLLLTYGAVPLLIAPLVWAFGAGIGNLLYECYKRPHKN